MELLERTPFLRTLAEYAGEARQGSGRLVLVSGESGIGKTALLEAFQAELPEARWLWGACDGLLTPRPLGPLFDIGGQAGGELAGLCRGGAARDQLFAAFLAEIDSPPARTVAVMEDVHWADEATIDLLSFLGRRLGRVPALVIATYRDDELGDTHPLRMVLGDLATQRATRRMRLPPLSEAAVRELVGERGVDAAELRRVTGGNPFYVREVLEAGWPSVPPTVRDAVRARLARCSTPTRRALESAAVAGARVDSSLMPWVVAGLSTSIEECLATGMVVPDGAGLRFRHELVRMAVDEGIAPHRKMELHASLLAELEARDDADPALLAHHADGAGDQLAVLRHAPEAARRSAALGAHREAAAQYERALRNAHNVGKPMLAALQEGVADEYALLDRWEDAEQARRAALALRRELGDQASVGKNLRILSTTLWRLCRGAECDRAAEEAVAVLEALPPGEELAWAYARLARVYLNMRGTNEATLTFLGKARDIAEKLGYVDVTCLALEVAGRGMVEAGRDGMPLFEEELRIALAEALPASAGGAYSAIVEACAKLHRFVGSERYYTEGLAYCEGRELAVYSKCMNGWRARTLVFLGRWDEATRLCARNLGSPGISPVNQLNPLIVLGTIGGRRGEGGAQELLDTALGFAEGTGEPVWIAPVRAARAELKWLEGRPDLAVAEARAGYDMAAGLVDPWTFGSLAIWLPRLGVPLDPPPDLPEPYALEIAGDHRGAAAAWEQIGRPYDAALAWLGSCDEAGLREALATLEDLGARAAAAAARRRMREVGVRAIPRGPRTATRTAPAGLTAREQEVLTLLADGLADREISERLFISERTVHHHVSAVLSKIGVASRTAAAREAARLGIAP
jgi:DNA-binding CsgD family transcriptional regulator/tetratricopeptide (TPR) repeat protein